MSYLTVNHNKYFYIFSMFCFRSQKFQLATLMSRNMACSWIGVQDVGKIFHPYTLRWPIHVLTPNAVKTRKFAHLKNIFKLRNLELYYHDQLRYFVTGFPFISSWLGQFSVPKAATTTFVTADECFRGWLSKINCTFENQLV